MRSCAHGVGLWPEHLFPRKCPLLSCTFDRPGLELCARKISSSSKPIKGTTASNRPHKSCLIRLADHMTKPPKPGLTWRKTAVWVMSTLVVSMILSIGMISQRIFLTSSLFRYTGLLYAATGLAPAIMVLVLCALKRPSGSHLWFVLLPTLSGLMFCIYLTLIGPGLYSEIECNSPIYSGLGVHQDCVCKWTESSDTSQVKCSLDGLRVLPFARLTEYR
jgi:hypothetical protein